MGLSDYPGDTAPFASNARGTQGVENSVTQWLLVNCRHQDV